MAPKFFVETFGCQMNYHDSERIVGLLERDGLEAASTESGADVIVLNTCSVRERAEEKLYTRLGELRVLARERDADPIIVVAGCVAQQEGDRLLKRDSSIDVIVGTQRIPHLPELVRTRVRDGARSWISGRSMTCPFRSASPGTAIPSARG